MVPHLTTALNGPLLALESKLLNATPDIERWLRGQWQEHTPPFYGSVDLRNSGFKLAPVDMNLFPGGFNNLNSAFLPLCVQAAMSAIDKICPSAKNLLLIPENHTRNFFYLQNVAQLATILRLTGLNVRLGSLLPEIEKPTPIVLPDGTTLLLEPLIRGQNRLGLEGFDPCAILLNNDLSAGIPPILQNLEEQFILPPLHAGWAVRRKSTHFAAYDEVASEFAQLLEIDPWQINPYFAVCSSVNFHERQGEECLSSSVDAVLGAIRKKYKEYAIDETPYVVVKADAGTYGMGVMTVKDASEIVGLNRKQRNKMSVVKEGMNVSQVIIQEGVHTHERVGKDDKAGVAEPVVYMIDRYVVGGFYRVHSGRGKDENLNAPGMHFEPQAFETSCSLPDQCQNPDAPPNRFYAYGVVSRLAHLAASIELERTAPAEV
ncbi:glutamate--cysteine ligase [Propionivibrio sp.]|uniref:glutamate--cysteine ligase n=1 Tax=Propionivibrio sp. TaxID=2212460 RepID=UPI0025DD5384|nr:glutamate--cysteine ligase [Propionivibrio sp.]MBK7357054.1 glutamate--cysteine ligase [Propionivibrio sp.]MBK8401516.1 glutamate--cysteine ligase [Propionivibrio sp.]MBK8745085.1 glutamate--cysteine ligase [Propionivibrio sp.]MBK8894074.1 glutamate--cysteine ligase [Propionivibrio sp.]MBL0208939.1 glutamate--cysteine ligase [Propionivibrio sp.]